MWLLLVAAGTGYFARWLQNVHRARPVTSGYGQNPRASPLTSAPSTPRRSSSLPRTLCYDSAMIESKLSYDTNRKVSTTYEDEALPCLETFLKPFLPGLGKGGTSEHEKSNAVPIREAAEKDCHLKVLPFEDANIWQQHSFGGIRSDESLLQKREIPKNFSGDIYISGDSCSKIYTCASPLNSHASSLEDVSVAKLFIKESENSSGSLDPPHQGMVSEALLMQTNVSACKPVDKVFETVTQKDQNYVSSNPHTFSSHNLEEHFRVKDGFTLQTEPSFKFPCGTNTILNNSPLGGEVSQLQEFWSTWLADKMQKREVNTSNQKDLSWENGCRCTSLAERMQKREVSTSDQEDLSWVNGQGDSTKLCNMKETTINADTCFSRSSIKPSTLLNSKSSGERSQSQPHSGGCCSRSLDGDKKNIHKQTKFLRGRGSLCRKRALTKFSKYASSIERHLRIQAMHAKDRNSFLKALSPSALLWPLLCLTPHHVEKGLGIKERGILKNHRSSMLSLDDGRIRDSDSGKMEGSTSTTEKVKKHGHDDLKPEMLQSNLDLISDEHFRTETLLSSFQSEKRHAKTSNDSGCELLTGFGMGIAILFMVSFSRKEIQKMGRVLQEVEELVHDMQSELDSRKASKVTTSLKVDAHKESESTEKVFVKQDLVDKQSNNAKAGNLTEGASEENFSDDDDSAKSVLTEEHVQDDCHISKLEAELEAELELIELNLQSYDSSKWEMTHSANLKPNIEENWNHTKGELSTHCLLTEYDSENDEGSSMLEEVNVNNYMVSAVDLERRLWNLLQQRLEEEIMELESALKLTENKLFLKEEELRWWKGHIKWLTKLSSGATSGEESLRNSIEECSVSLGNAENRPWWIFLEEQESLSCTLRSLENEMVCSPSGSKEFMKDERCGGEHGGPKNIGRTFSACSFSSDESALPDGLSLEIVTSCYQGCNESIQPVQNCKLNLHTAEEPDSENPSLLKHLSYISRESSTSVSSPKVLDSLEEFSISNV